MREACIILETPVTGGNVSFYNESAAGNAVDPSPIVACVGVMPDYSYALTFQLKEAGSELWLVGERYDELGGSAFYLHNLFVVLLLLGWHLIRRDPWRVDRRVFLGMGAESLAFALPPLVFYAALTQGATATATKEDWGMSLLLSLSAGIYEETIFRLVLISLVVFLLADVARLRRAFSEVGAVLIGALLFAAYHYRILGGPYQFNHATFTFRVLLGVYFGGVFVLRGLGIVGGAHILYNLAVYSFFWKAGLDEYAASC